MCRVKQTTALDKVRRCEHDSTDEHTQSRRAEHRKAFVVRRKTV